MEWENGGDDKHVALRATITKRVYNMHVRVPRKHNGMCHLLQKAAAFKHCDKKICNSSKVQP